MDELQAIGPRSTPQLKIVLAANCHGFVGIEYEGAKLDEYAGIRATKKLLETVRDELSAK